MNRYQSLLLRRAATSILFEPPYLLSLIGNDKAVAFLSRISFPRRRRRPKTSLPELLFSIVRKKLFA